VARAELDKSITYYALRHSSIVRLLKAGKPPFMVADMHDTSIKTIERHYARHISSQNEMMRDGLIDLDLDLDEATDNKLDLDGATGDNVVIFRNRS
jgi:hypothetical protein